MSKSSIVELIKVMEYYSEEPCVEHKDVSTFISQAWQLIKETVVTSTTYHYSSLVSINEVFRDMAIPYEINLKPNDDDFKVVVYLKMKNVDDNKDQAKRNLRDMISSFRHVNLDIPGINEFRWIFTRMYDWAYGRFRDHLDNEYYTTEEINLLMYHKKINWRAYYYSSETGCNDLLRLVEVKWD